MRQDEQEIWARRRGDDGEWTKWMRDHRVIGEKSDVYIVSSDQLIEGLESETKFDRGITEVDNEAMTE